MAKKKKAVMKEWVVPVSVTIQTTCIVDAEDESAAEAAAEAGQFRDVDFSGAGEMVDWEVRGDPEENC